MGPGRSPSGSRTESSGSSLCAQGTKFLAWIVFSLLVFHYTYVPYIQYAVGGLDQHGRILRTAELYDLKSGRWTPLPPMATPRSGCGAAILDGLLYVVGGYSIGGMKYNTVECFSPASNSWKSLPPMQNIRGVCGVAALGGLLYVVGGMDCLSPDNPMECFDPAANTWAPLPPVPRDVCDRCGVGVLGGLLYVVGGIAWDEHPVNTVDCFNPVTNSWVSLPPMAVCRGEPSVVALHGKLSVIGGVDKHGCLKNSTPMECFDPISHTWAAYECIPCWRVGCCVKVLQGMLYVAGGVDGTGRLGNTFCCYGSMACSRQDFAMAAV